jgi:CheY-like chemotaxis protein
MGNRNKVLLVDDDPALLETYRELLQHLPSRPDIETATSGPKAFARLEAEPFRLLICDLKMPRMDGLQVLSIVRRKFPKLRTVAMTALQDEQFRSRVYALGVDLFWHKPSNQQEIKLFLECLESLLGTEDDSGFRGIQSKSLLDLVQLECLSQTSSVLRITNGSQTGKIWIQDGEVVDAEAGDQIGEDAFRRIFSWRGGGFDSLPAEPARPRRITQSYSGLLLDSAQALDEAAVRREDSGVRSAPGSPIVALAAMPELNFAVIFEGGNPTPQFLGALENPEGLGAWTKETLLAFRELGDGLQAGPVSSLEGRTLTHAITLFSCSEAEGCVGWKPGTDSARVRELTDLALSLWAC